MKNRQKHDGTGMLSSEDRYASEQFALNTAVYKRHGGLSVALVVLFRQIQIQGLHGGFGRLLRGDDTVAAVGHLRHHHTADDAVG